MSKIRVFKTLMKETIEPSYKEGYRMPIGALIDRLMSLNESGTTHVKFCGESDEGVGSGWLVPEIGRWETEQEHQNRLFKENNYKAAQEIKDREQYERLKKRFEA